MYTLELNDIADRHLSRILELQAKDNGDTIFLINDEQRISFAEAEESSNRLASGFQSLGVEDVRELFKRSSSSNSGADHVIVTAAGLIQSLNEQRQNVITIRLNALQGDDIEATEDAN